jgi:hypothetical protein
MIASLSDRRASATASGNNGWGEDGVSLTNVFVTRRDEVSLTEVHNVIGIDDGHALAIGGTVVLIGNYVLHVSLSF